MACLIILFNWFPLGLSPLIVALWDASYYFIPILQDTIGIDSTKYYVRDSSYLIKGSSLTP